LLHRLTTTRLPEIEVSGIAARHSRLKLPQASAPLDVRRPTRPIPDHLAIGANEGAGPALAQPSHGWLHHLTMSPIGRVRPQ
jgi:hypothetical protein